jgi:hypothetical protein
MVVFFAVYYFANHPHSFYLPKVTKEGTHQASGATHFLLEDPWTRKSDRMHLVLEVLIHLPLLYPWRSAHLASSWHYGSRTFSIKDIVIRFDLPSPSWQLPAHLYFEKRSKQPILNLTVPPASRATLRFQLWALPPWYGSCLQTYRVQDIFLMKKWVRNGKCSPSEVACLVVFAINKVLFSHKVMLIPSISFVAFTG